MIVGKQQVQAYFDSISKPYFAIFAKGQVEKGNSIFRNDKNNEDREIDQADARREFERTLDFLSYGDYTLIASDKKDVTTRGSNRVDFKIPISEVNNTTAQNNAPAVAGLGIGAVSLDQVEATASAIAEKKFTELMIKKENADLKEKNKELEAQLKEANKASSEPLNKLLTAVAPHSEHIVAGLFGRTIQAPLTVSGITPDSTGGPDPNAQKIMEDFVAALSEQKPHEWLQIIKQLTQLIKTDPQKFETALKFL